MRTATRQQKIEIHAGKGEHVPAILQIPDALAPVPAVLLLHGFSSRKEWLADSIGVALTRQGVASLAIDLPLHGSRARAPEQVSMENPLALVRIWRLALREATAAVRFLVGHPDIDAARLGLGGYSLGAYLALFLAAENADVRAVALVAGGDLPHGIPMERLVRAAANPLKAVRALRGRPLLMVNGRGDRTIRPAQATALFEEAREPKELVWYEGGHWPPPSVINDVARWLASEIEARSP